jgi:hypothetical protein
MQSSDVLLVSHTSREAVRLMAHIFLGSRVILSVRVRFVVQSVRHFAYQIVKVEFVKMQPISTVYTQTKVTQSV